ncbi:MAG: ATP-binding cassette domain-containing protein [Caldisericia bacterium]
MEARVKRMVLVEEPTKEKDIKLRIESTGRTGEIVFKTTDLGMSFGEKKLFSNSNLELKRGQKVALIGLNGTGKTTFLKMVLGKIKPTEGEIWDGYSVLPTYLEQELASFDKDNSVLDEIMKDTDLHIPEARNHLAKFDFTGDEVFKKCGVLSGGEISRLILSKLALIESNFLIMDEPTNHLDIKARTAIEDTLKDYNGTILIVSHDRYFISQVGARIWDLSGGQINDTKLTLEEYLSSKNKPIKQETDDSSKKTEAEKVEKPKTSKLSKNKIREIEEKISIVEERLSSIAKEKNELERHMAGETDYQMGHDDFKRYTELNENESELLIEWEELSEQLT